MNASQPTVTRAMLMPHLRTKNEPTLSPKTSWEQRQRLMLLEARLIWTGSARAGDLRDAFDITTGKAERDIEYYRSLRASNLQFDAETGAYEPGDQFEPLFLRGTASELLDVLRNHELAENLPLAMATGGYIPAESLELPQREFDIRILQRLATAIRTRRWLLINYQSMSQPEPRALRIAPHVLVHVARWHARAWSEEHQAYRDFLLSRICGLPELGEACSQAPEHDWDWRNHVRVRVAPHPGLSDAQKRVVEQDYGMRAGVMEHSVRLALVPYYLRLLGLSRDDRERPAAEQQIILMNRAELETFNRLA